MLIEVTAVKQKHQIFLLLFDITILNYTQSIITINFNTKQVSKL